MLADESNRLAKLRLEYERLWNYFSYHAEQRIKTFHLFLVIAGLISSGLAIIFAKAGINEQSLVGGKGVESASSGYRHYHHHHAPPENERSSECCDKIRMVLEDIKEVINSGGDITQFNVAHLPNLLVIMLILGVLLIFFSWVFWKLDERNHTLVSIARAQLLEMEKKGMFEYEIFSLVEKDVKLHDPMRFKTCIQCIYLMMSLIGLIIIIFSIYKM